ncbi:MAG TPA: CpsD/CapB family tyrosine-protein kinase [Actinoplanes sp.]|nr:CpsD/CapB family tyrosine-protein kinase [Actinoplanes sp.]
MTTATIAAAYALNQQAPSTYRSEATILIEARLTGATAVVVPSPPAAATEREIALSETVLLPAAGRVGSGTGDFARDLTVDVIPGTGVLRVVYTADNAVSAQVRAKALVEAYVAYRAEGPADVTVLTPPTLAAEPDTRPLAPDLAAGLAAGLLLGAGTALLRSRTRGPIRSRDDFAALTGVPVLATIPRSGRTSTRTPVVLGAPGSPAAESYRYLRSRLQKALRPTGTTTILVTSPGDRQGRTTTAANLAVTLAQAGRSVVLVDADLRNPRLHHVFQVAGDHGLTTLLDGDTGVSEVIEETRVPRLSVIPAGRRDGDHADLMDSAQLARVLRAVQKHADVVVIDTSAVLSAADAIALAALSDVVLLVGDYRRTRRDTVRRALAELSEAVDGNISPVLVNVPKSAGGLIPRPRVHSVVHSHGHGHGPLTRDHLTSDADDVAPPGVTSHTYVQVATLPDHNHAELADFYARTTTVGVPVIYGSTQTATVYASTNAAATTDDDVLSPEDSTTDGPAASPDDSAASDVPPVVSASSDVPAVVSASNDFPPVSSGGAGSGDSPAGSEDAADEDLQDLAAASSPADIAGLDTGTADQNSADNREPESTTVVPSSPGESPASTDGNPSTSAEAGKNAVQIRS